MPEPCTQPNPWVTTFRTCVRSMGHDGSHRDQLGGRWYDGQGRIGGEVSGQAHGSGHGPMAPLTPQALATPHPPPPTARERELEAQLDQERQDHARTRRELERALILAEAQAQEGARGE